VGRYRHRRQARWESGVRAGGRRPRTNRLRVTVREFAPTGGDGSGKHCEGYAKNLRAEYETSTAPTGRLDASTRECLYAVFATYRTRALPWMPVCDVRVLHGWATPLSSNKTLYGRTDTQAPMGYSSMVPSSWRGGEVRSARMARDGPPPQVPMSDGQRQSNKVGGAETADGPHRPSAAATAARTSTADFGQPTGAGSGSLEILIDRRMCISPEVVGSARGRTRGVNPRRFVVVKEVTRAFGCAVLRSCRWCRSLSVFAGLPPRNHDIQRPKIGGFRWAAGLSTVAPHDRPPTP